MDAYERHYGDVWPADEVSANIIMEGYYTDPDLAAVMDSLMRENNLDPDRLGEYLAPGLVEEEVEVTITPEEVEVSVEPEREKEKREVPQEFKQLYEVTQWGLAFEGEVDARAFTTPEDIERAYEALRKEDKQDSPVAIRNYILQQVAAEEGVGEEKVEETEEIVERMEEGATDIEDIEEFLEEIEETWSKSSARQFPKTGTEFWREAADGYPPYHKDELVTTYFGRDSTPPGKPIFRFGLGDEGTLEELDLPDVSCYLDDIAQEQYGIENFCYIVNYVKPKLIKFIISRSKPHSVWDSDDLLLVNLYRVHNMADLMAVLVHEFKHVMTTLVGEPMSEKDERSTATPEEYAEFPEEQGAYVEMIKFRSFILREPEDYIRDKLLDVVGEDNEDKVDEWIDIALHGMEVTAGYPKHPDTIVVESEYYPGGLTEKDVWDYYDHEKEDIVAELKGHNVMLVIKANGEIYRRHPDSKEEFIRIDSVEDFDHYNNGRTIEFHKVVGEQTDYGYVDIDPKEEVPFDEAKRIASDVADLLSEQEDIDQVELAFSGSRGFHIYPHYKQPKPPDDARGELRELLGSYIEESGDEKLTTGVTREPDVIRLDTSTLKRMGSLRVPGSLNVRTGLRCTPVSREELARFRKESAKIKGITKAESFFPETEREFLEELVLSEAAN